MDKLNMAILATGGIAQLMADTLAAMPQINCYAVASRDLGRAQQFAQKNGFERAYGSYKELVQDEKVQLVYVASPHSHHYEHARLCLENGRPVLCEKAFTANAQQARELLALSKEKGIFITEAIWPRYMPLSRTLRGMVQDGTIGKPVFARAELGFLLTHVPRMTRPELAGGALLDLGVYPINFASMVFGGDVVRTASTVKMLDTGVDAIDNITLYYSDGRLAVLTAGMLSAMENRGVVCGEEGVLVVEGINNLKRIRHLSPSGDELAVIPCPPQISGYEYEVEACLAALREGRIECLDMPHAETLRIMELMDSLRHEWGVRYPFE